MDDNEIRVALTTEPLGRDQWQWVLVYASAREIVKVDRSSAVFGTVAEAVAAGQKAIDRRRDGASENRLH